MGCSVRTAKGQTQRFLIWEMDMEIAIAMTVISGVVLNREPNDQAHRTVKAGEGD